INLSPLTHHTLTPADDTVPESEFWTMAPDGVSVQAARVPLAELQTYSDPRGPDNAVEQLAALPLHSIVFAFTGRTGTGRPARGARGYLFPRLPLSPCEGGVGGKKDQEKGCGRLTGGGAHSRAAPCGPPPDPP